jgi:uncharacterized protein YbjT (DUF2867 family)
MRASVLGTIKNWRTYMKVLVAGGTGMVGTRVVGELQSRGAEVSVLTRESAKVPTVAPGVGAIVGNFLDPLKLLPEFRRFDALFLLIPALPTESFEGLTALNLAREAGIKRIVYLSVQQDSHTPEYVPHVGAKLLIESAIRKSGLDYTFIRPNVFMQNDRFFQHSILQDGIYPQPIGDRGCSMCDVRDIAQAAAIALDTGRAVGQSYTIAGPDILTGTSIAKVWAASLGRPITYGGNDMDAWAAAQLRFGMPTWCVFEIRIMYEAWQANGLVATPQELDHLSELLGHNPRSYRHYVDEQRDEWAKLDARAS